MTVRPARATWNTGFFQEALVRRGLEQLGYNVEKPKDLPNPIFYKSVTLGDVDYWANGWFPMHDAQTPKDFADKAVKIGYVAKAGGMQGYLVSKREVKNTTSSPWTISNARKSRKRSTSTATARRIWSPALRAGAAKKPSAYQHEGLRPGRPHQSRQGLIRSGHGHGAGQLQGRKTGLLLHLDAQLDCVQVKPGKDVMWINVPRIIPSEEQKGSEDRMVANDVVGAVTNPLKPGFVITDIMTVANKKFLENNPAAADFLKNFNLPLADIAEQNNRMNEGEKSAKDIEKHADEWIAKNQEKWNAWLTSARNAAN